MEAGGHMSGGRESHEWPLTVPHLPSSIHNADMHVHYTPMCTQEHACT